MKGKSILFSTKHRFATGSISFMPKTGQKSLFASYIANRNDIDPNGALDVIAHGSYKEIEVSGVDGIIRINPRTAAKLIRKQPGYKAAKAIRLLSCSTGSKADGFAQHLANALGKPVIAPNMAINSYSNGVHWIGEGSQRGEFVEFKPGGIKYGK